MSDVPAATAAASTPTQVAVTVTTTRTEQEDGVRQATARGDFDTAVREALSARLQPWAIDQVLGRVLARRPPAGDAVRYEGSFSPERHVRITVAPLQEADPPPPCTTRRLPGLFLPIPAEPATALTPSTGRRPWSSSRVQTLAPSPGIVAG